jgi:5-methylthioadenosine/S-adenosylhomocysteine deaminase
MRILTADHVLPITSEPISDGAVVIDDGSIVAVGTRASISSIYPQVPVENFGRCAIIPGLVNCHSHLEITGMRGALDAVENDFYKWLISLTKLRGEVLDPADIEDAAIAGAAEGARAGVTCFGDIGRNGHAGFQALKAVGLRGVLFQETEFSADVRTAPDDLEKLIEKFSFLSERSTDIVEVGISPHAPYTVSDRLFGLIAEFARKNGTKISIHAAESQDEDELMRCGTGFFTTVYEKFGIEWQSPHCSSIEFLKQTGILETRPLLAHCITVSIDDIDTIAATRSTVAHCPKSNAKFGHGYAPFELFRMAGIDVGLGTDSMASNNRCDLFEEARMAAFASRNRNGRVGFTTAADCLFAATLGGARALGLDDKVGSLETGKQADIAVVALDSLAQMPLTDIYAGLVFSTAATDVVMTMVAGREVYQNRKLVDVDEVRLMNRLSEIGQKIANCG